MIAQSPWLWAGFFALILTMLVIDLGVFQRKAHAPTLREAAIWTGVWIGMALLFNGVIYLWQGAGPALEFTTGYLIEKALSVDNLFVFALVFSIFAVPNSVQHRVLFWGVVGALVMRGLFIAAGTALLTHFHWVVYLFGGFLVFTGVKLAVQKETEIHPERNPILRAARRVIPLTDSYHGEHFFIRSAGKLFATPLLLVLIVIESTDLVFAVDSIPAILAITQDPFLVYTSNVFAILGLRSLYFLLAGALDRLHYLKLALAVILSFVGVKMLISEFYKIPIFISLLFIAGTLVIAVAASLYRTRKLQPLEETASGH